MMKRTSILLILGALLLTTAPMVAAAGDSDTVRTTLQVTGMHCDGCSATIIGTLERIKGVESATADHEKGVAEAVHRTKKVSPEKLKAAIEKLGYTVTDMRTEAVED
jgi:copper chaperone CopZ